MADPDALSPRSRRLPAAALRCAFLAAVSAALVGCAADSYVGARTVVVHGKFDHLNCEQIEGHIKTTRAKIDELIGLQAQAARETSGMLIGAAVYGPTLAEAKGNLRIYQETHAEKKCASSR